MPFTAQHITQNWQLAKPAASGKRGLVVSQFLTLFITPVLYLYMDRLGSAGNRLRERVMGAMSGKARAA